MKKCCWCIHFLKPLSPFSRKLFSISALQIKKYLILNHLSSDKSFKKSEEWWERASQSVPRNTEHFTGLTASESKCPWTELLCCSWNWTTAASYQLITSHVVLKLGTVIEATFALEMSPPTHPKARRSRQRNSTQKLFLYLCRVDLCLFSSLDFYFP